MESLKHSRVLIADADATNVELLERLLDDGGYCDVLCAKPKSVANACALANPDLVVLDCDSSEQSGSIVNWVRSLIPDGVGILLVGGRSDLRLQECALALGEADFMTKPIDPSELLLRVRNLLQNRELRRELETRSNVLDDLVGERTREVEQAGLETLSILASVAEFQDDDTRQHTLRVGNIASAIAERLGLPEPHVTLIRHAAPLHDLGKIGISRRVLLKPGKLTPAERENMMRHVEIGARILGSPRSPVLRLAAEIAGTHHERWDGDGYLAGLAGEDIPISGRITAVADVFDALVHDRPYRPAWEFDLALEEIAAQAGRQFDPRVIEAFQSIERDTLTQLALADGAERGPEAERSASPPQAQALASLS